MPNSKLSGKRYKWSKAKMIFNVGGIWTHDVLGRCSTNWATRAAQLLSRIQVYKQLNCYSIHWVKDGIQACMLWNSSLALYQLSHQSSSAGQIHPTDLINMSDWMGLHVLYMYLCSYFQWMLSALLVHRFLIESASASILGFTAGQAEWLSLITNYTLPNELTSAVSANYSV